MAFSAEDLLHVAFVKFRSLRSIEERVDKQITSCLPETERAAAVASPLESFNAALAPAVIGQAMSDVEALGSRLVARGFVRGRWVGLHVLLCKCLSV